MSEESKQTTVAGPVIRGAGEVKPGESVYSYPEHDVAVAASSREEADKKLETKLKAMKKEQDNG